MPRTRAPLALLGVCLLALLAPAAEGPAYSEAVAAFDKERAEAKAPPADLAAADEFAARAKAAADAGNAAQALRLVREARRAIPVPAAPLPAGVTRAFGGGHFRHADRVTGMSFAPDGRRLATSSRDGTVKVWNVENGRELLTYRGHAAAPADPTNVLRVPNVAFAPDGKTVASSGGKLIHVWDAATGERTQTLTGHAAAARGLAFTPDGKYLVSGGDDRMLIVWDLSTGKAKLKYPELAGRIEAVAVSAGKGAGRLIASVTADGALIVYPFADEVKPQLLGLTVTAGGEGNFGVAFVGETPNVLTCGGDSRVKLTTGPDPAAAVAGAVGGTVRTYTGHAGRVGALAATPDGTRFVTGGADRTARVWETATGKTLATFTSAALPSAGETREVGVSAVAISPDGTVVAAGTVEGTLQLWPLTADDESRKSADATDSLWNVAVSPDGTTFATVGADKVARLYDSATGKLVKSLTGHAGAVPALAYLSDTVLATASGDRLVKLWDATTGRATDLAGHTSAVLAVTANGPTRRVFSGGVDQTVRAWDAAGKPLGAWAAGSPVTALAARPDGTRLAVGTADGTLTILTAPATGDPVRVASIAAHTSGVGAAAFHPDGVRLLTCGGDGLAKLWTVNDAAAPTLLARLEPSAGAPKTGAAMGYGLPPVGVAPAPAPVAVPVSPLSAVAFSPDGKLFALGGADATVRLWSTAGLAEVRAFRGHADWVTGVAFTADGRAVLSTSADKTVRRFDVPRAEAAATAGHTGAVQAVAVSPNGLLLATAGRDRAIKIWSLADGRLLTTLTGSGAAVNVLAFLSDETLASSGSDGRVRWWALAGAGRELRSAATGPGQMNFSLHADAATGRVACVGSQPDGTSTFDLFDAAGKPVAQIVERGRRLSCATLSADLGLVATAGDDGTVRLWDFATKERVGGDWPLAPVGVRDMAFSPDKSKLVAIDAAGQLRIAGVKDRAAGAPFPGGPGPMGVVTAPTGDRFGVFFDDGTVKTWTLAGVPLKTWKLPAPVTSLTFAPDGKSAVAGLSDGAAMQLK